MRLVGVRPLSHSGTVFRLKGKRIRQGDRNEERGKSYGAYIRKANKGEGFLEDGLKKNILADSAGLEVYG